MSCLLAPIPFSALVCKDALTPVLALVTFRVAKSLLWGVFCLLEDAECAVASLPSIQEMLAALLSCWDTAQCPMFRKARIVPGSENHCSLKTL